MLNSLLITIPAFVLALGLLIVVHEFGHFWVARKVGVKVLRFSVGFGKPLWRYQRSPEDTEFVLSLIPLGGYVSMLDEREREVPEAQRHLAFNNQKLHHRTAIVVAGPLFNFIFAILAYWMMFSVGLPGLKPTVADIEPNSIAEVAGIQAGEQIIAVDGKETATWGAASMQVLTKSLNDSSIELTLMDANQQLRQVTLDLPEVDSEFGKKDGLFTLGLIPKRPKIEAIIGELQSDSAAEEAGLRSGDKLVMADGEPITDWFGWVNYVRERPEQPIVLTLVRDGQEITLAITPRRVEEKGHSFGRIGAAARVTSTAMPPELMAVQHYGPLDAVAEAIGKTWDMSIMSLQVMGRMIIGEVSLQNLSGPLTIAQYAGYSAQSGLPSFLAFLAVISLSLGVINLLPVPMLDGGHLLYYLIEFVKGSPLSEHAQALGLRIGMFIILMLMSIALYNDLIRLLG